MLVKGTPGHRSIIMHKQFCRSLLINELPDVTGTCTADKIFKFILLKGKFYSYIWNLLKSIIMVQLTVSQPYDVTRHWAMKYGARNNIANPCEINFDYPSKVPHYLLRPFWTILNDNDMKPMNTRNTEITHHMVFVGYHRGKYAGRLALSSLQHDI